MEILDTVLPVFVVMGAGYLLRVTGQIEAAVNAAFARLVFYVAAPALLFRGAALAPLSESVDLKTLAVLGGATLAVAFAVYAAAARAAPARRGVLAQGAHRSNMVFVGLPVAAYACGEEVLGAAAVFIGFMVIVCNLLSVLVLVLPHNRQALKGGAARRTLLEILGNPLILSCAAGLLFSAWDIRLPVSVDRSLELIGAIALPLALLSSGASIDLGKLCADGRTAAWVSLIKLVVHPGLVYLGLRWAGLEGAGLACPVLVMAAPTAVVSAVMAREMKGDEPLAAAIVIGSTLGSLFTLSGWIWLLGAG
ncbi:MAG: AEC family transporter [Planctomycetes bacterium]|nr:AEC family transporter [Planctomycetota bacterium]